MTDLNELAARVEALTGPDRGVDLAISVAIDFKSVFAGFDAHWAPARDEIIVSSHKVYTTMTGAKKRNTGFLDPVQFVPHWTTSIDAAYSLKPPGWLIESATELTLLAGAECVLVDPNSTRSATGAGYDIPLAITAAALRARGME